MYKKVSIARLSVFSNLFLILIKLIVGILSGSVSILSEAIHSTMDLIASLVAFFSVRLSNIARPQASLMVMEKLKIYQEWLRLY